jgi:periplasmic protein TonB
MRSTKPGQEELKSIPSSQVAGDPQENFGISALTRCLVDAEGNTMTGAGGARRKALGVSALVQFCTLAGLLIVPLFATGTRLILRHTDFVPIPPYGGAPRDLPHAEQAVRTEHVPKFPVNVDVIHAPTRPPTTITSVNDAETTLGTSTSMLAPGPRGTGEGPAGLTNFIPGGSDTGAVPPRPEESPVVAPRKAVPVSQGVQLALLTRRVEPVYPLLAIHMHTEGRVELRAIISSEGVVKELHVVSGDPVLAKAAYDAVAQWRFRPTLLNGIAVEVDTFVTVNFHLDQ